MKTIITRIKRLALALCFATPFVSRAETTYSTDYMVTGSATAYTSSAGNANVTWQNFNFRAAVDKDHLAHGYYFYLKDGDTDIGETGAAVKLDSITLTWGNNTDAFGADDTPYLVVTTPDESPVIIAVSNAGDKRVASGTSTFTFSNVVLASNAKYRFYFYKNDVSGLSVGDVLTGQVQARITGRYHNTARDARADYNDIRCSGGAGYSIDCSFVVSPLVADDATVLETSSTAVSVGSVATPVVIEGKVADGIVEVGSAATVSGVFTVCGEATTLELSDSLTATAFYFPATVTIDASAVSGLDPTGEASSKTTALLSGALKYTTAPTVILPTATAGMIYETNITSSGISVTVVKGVDCVETISGDTSWSTIKPEGWVNSMVGDKPAIAIAYEGEETVTLTFDEAVQAGSLTLTGNIVVEASAAATFGTVNAGAGSVVEMANMTITTQSGSGVYRYRTGYPSTVPNNSLTYEYVGTDDSENPGTVNLNGMRGTVRTTGYMNITGYLPLLTNAKLDVVSGTTTLTAGSKAICGYITIREGATLVNTATDSLDYSRDNSIFDIYGTLDMRTSRWTVWSGAMFNLRGGEVVGAGEGTSGALDFMGTCNVTAYANSTISANVKFRNALSNVTVNDGVTLTISGVTRPGYDSGGVTKKGAGTLKFTSDPYVPGGITVEAGTLAFDTESDVDPVVTYAASVLNSANMDYVSASNWKGRVVVSAVAAGTTTTQVALNKTGNENSYLTLNGISGNAWCAGSNYTVQPEITLAGDVNFQDGYSNKAVTFRKIAAGTGNLSLKSWSGCTGITYGFTTLDADNYTGTIQLDGSVLTFNVGNILKAGAAVGDNVLPLTVTNNATVNLSNAKLNGEAAGFELREDGVYYTTAYVTINVPAVDNTTVNVVSSSGVVVDNGDGTYKVANGATVTVTYTSDDYEVTGGTFEFTASEGYTVNTTEVVTKQYVASITVGETTTKYSSLQAAVDAVAQNKDIVLLDNVVDGATVAREVTFYVVPGEYTHGDIAAGGDYILTTTASEGKTRYSVSAALIAVTINDVRTLYPATMDGYTAAIEAANAGPIGTTLKVLYGDYTAYVAYLPMFDLDTDTGVFTKVADPVAAVYNGKFQQQVYRTLAEAVTAATSGQTVKLLADVTLTGALDAVVFPATFDGTLDLNGHSIQRLANSYYVLDIVNGAKVTITDSSAGGEGMVKGTPVASGKVKSPASMIRVKGKLTLESGKLVSDYCCVKVDEDPGVGEFVMNGGTVEIIANEQGYTGLTFTIMNWGVATVNNGTHKGNVQSLSYSGNIASKASTLTINGGSFDPANIYMIAYDTDYAPTVKIVNTITTLTVVNNSDPALGYKVSGPVEEGNYNVYTLAVSSGINPTDPTSTQEVTPTAEEIETYGSVEEAAIAKATVKVPDGVSGVDAATYKTYFTYSAKETGTAGTYAVAITGFADDVTETADGNALAALEAATAGGTLSAEVAVKPGLYYGTAAGTDVTTLKASAGELNTTGKLDLSVVTKPSTGEAFFIKIKVSTTAFTAEE